MLHRVILGSIERFIGALIEHYGGAFPLWLSPVQATIVPITKKQNDYASEIEAFFKEKDFRVAVDNRDEKMQKKIRDSELEKIPYIVIVGEREVKEKKLSIRSKAKGNLGVMSREELLDMLTKENGGVVRKSL